MRWFPCAGGVVGAVVLGAVLVGAKVDPWFGAMAGLTAWIAVTGALHLDGLGDIADAAGAAHADARRVSSVLADPHIGSFGVVAIVLQCIAKLVLLHALAAAITARTAADLLLIPAIARLAPLYWANALPALHTGLGSLFANGLRRRDLAIWSLVLLAACILFEPVLLLAPMLAAGWGYWLRLRIGGISGDGHGAGIEILESALLLAVVVAR